MKNNIYSIILISSLMISSCVSTHPDLNDGLYADIKTNKGDILINLTFEETPITVANFVSLSEGKNKEVSSEFNNKKYYDGLIFHRVIENFMIQGGDPTGTGRGGPGYNFKDEFKENLLHDSKGILSMANSGPKSNGSQFFITHKETPWLNGKHTVFGKVIKGIEIIDLIEQNDTIKTVSIVRKGRKAKSFNASKIFTNHFEEDQMMEDQKAALIESVKAGKKTAHESEKSFSIKTDTGLKYTITYKSENGEKVSNNKIVMTHYAVYFEDGSLLDTSILEIAEQYQTVNIVKKNQGGYSPIEAKIGPEDSMISGFKEGLKLLKVGDKATLFLPYYLAYGETGRSPQIPPKSNLIFEVEIIELK
jgi:peptidylprolyl isomerase